MTVVLWTYTHSKISPNNNPQPTTHLALRQVVLEIYKVFPVDRVQRRFRSRSLSFPIQVAAVAIFSQSRAPQRLPRIFLDKLVKGFFALFPKKNCDTTSALEVGTASALEPMDASCLRRVHGA